MGASRTDHLRQEHKVGQGWVGRPQDDRPLAEERRFEASEGPHGGGSPEEEGKALMGASRTDHLRQEHKVGQGWVGRPEDDRPFAEERGFD